MSITEKVKSELNGKHGILIILPKTGSDICPFSEGDELAVLWDNDRVVGGYNLDEWFNNRTTAYYIFFWELGDGCGRERDGTSRQKWRWERCSGHYEYKESVESRTIKKDGKDVTVSHNIYYDSKVITVRQRKSIRGGWQPEDGYVDVLKSFACGIIITSIVSPHYGTRTRTTYTRREFCLPMPINLNAMTELEIKTAESYWNSLSPTARNYITDYTNIVKDGMGFAVDMLEYREKVRNSVGHILNAASITSDIIIDVMGNESADRIAGKTTVSIMGIAAAEALKATKWGRLGGPKVTIATAAVTFVVVVAAESWIMPWIEDRHYRTHITRITSYPSQDPKRP